MNNKKKVTVATLFCILLSGATCNTQTRTASDLGNYFEAKTAFSSVLDEWLSGQNEKWRVIPIYGPVYEPGTPLEPGSTEPLTDKCLVPKDAVNDDPMTSFPKISADYNFSLDASIPASIAEAKSKMVSGGADLSASSESKLEYTELTQRAVRRDVFDESLMQLDCLAVIAGREVTVVRGLIVGKEAVSSTKALSAGAKVDVMSREGLKLTYDNSGGFRLEDTEPQPKYYYVYNLTIPIEIPSNAKMSTRRTAIERYLEQNADSQFEAVERRTSDAEAEALVKKMQERAD